MSTRRVLPLLALVPLLAFVAAWLWLQSDQRPVSPANGGPVASADNSPAPLELPQPGTAGPEPAANAAQPLVIAPPPPPPEVTNDPAKGEVWLRVLDASTNQPLARTTCNLWGLLSRQADGYAKFDGQGEYPDDSGRIVLPLRVADTDERGLLKLSATVAALDMAELLRLRPSYEGETRHLSGFDVDFPPEKVGLVYPVPEGFEPVTPPHELAAQVAELREKPLGHALDVRVRPAPSLCGTVTDVSGQPIAGARVAAFPVLPTESTFAWTILRSAPYRATLEVYWTDTPPMNEAPDFVEGVCRIQVGETVDDQNWICQFPSCEHEIDISESSYLYESGFLAYHETYADAAGNYSLPNLISGKWLVLAYSPVHRPELVTARLAGTRARCDLVLGASPLGSLEIVLRQCEGGQSTGWCNVNVVKAGPEGAPSVPIGGCAGFDFEIAEGGAAKPLVIGHLEPGLWYAGVNDDWGGHGYIVEIQAGRITRLEVPVGEKALAVWKPLLRFGGQVVPGGCIYLRGGTDSGPQCLDLVWEDDQPPAVNLGAGEYTAWVPGLQPLRFTLQPGETREDVLDIPAATATFSIDAELAALLNGESTELGPEVTLDLIGVDVWEDTRFLEALGAVLHAQDEGYDRLTPGQNSNWWLPPGEYQWALHGNEQSLHGRLQVPPGSSRVHFTLGNLPGLAVFELHYPDDDPENPAEADLETLYAADKRVPVRRVLDENGVPVHDTDLEGVPLPQPEINEFHLSTQKRWLFIAPPGTYSLGVYHNTGEWQGVVTLAGKRTLRAADFVADGTAPSADLNLTCPEDYEGDFEEIFGIASNGEASDLGIGPCNSMPPGPITLFVEMYRYDDQDNRTGPFYARHSLTLGADGATVALDTLKYEPAGTLNITCRGRGDPGNPVDPWWMGAHGQGPRLYALYALDQGLPGAPRAVAIPGPDAVSTTGGKPEFRYTELLLPPGRYRAVPWRNAPEKYCREFDVRGGETTEVVIQGG